MRPSLSKNLFLFSSFSSSCSYSFSPSPARALLLRLQVRYFSASSNYASLPHSPHYSRLLEEESRNVRVSVWWDFENCNPPVWFNISRIAPAITEAVRANGIKGPIQITAFGDVLQLSRNNQEILACSGIQLTHVPNGGKNSADRSLLIDLMYWVSQNPPPAHLFLISGDKDFAGVLHRLRMNNYNILLASPVKAPDVLRSAATIMWHWPSLLKGEDLTGKRFNYPPDGPYGSWYGNYKIPLEKPFSAHEQYASVQNVETCEPTPETPAPIPKSVVRQVRPLEKPFSASGQSASVQNVETCEPTPDSPAPVPKSVVRQVRQILSSFPKGISIGALRAELTKCNVRLDKSLYGYKKFSLFLLSLPHVHLQYLGDGKFCVCLIPPESSGPFARNNGPSLASTANDDERGHATALKLNEDGITVASDADGTHSMASLHESSSEKVGDVADAQLSETKLPPEGNEDSKSKVDFIKTSSEKLPDNEIVESEDVSPNISEKYTTSEIHSAENDYTRIENDCIENDESGKFIAEDNKCEWPPRKDADEVCHGPSSLPVDDSVVDERPGRGAETCSKSPTFFGWIRSWWPSWKSRAKSDDLTAHETKEVSHSEEPKLSELDQTISHAEGLKLSDEEPKLAELDQTISHAEELKLSDEEPKLFELDQTISLAEESKLSDEEPKFSQPEQNVGHCVEPKSSKVDQNVDHPEKLELFSRTSFWNLMESFVSSPKGSLLFSLSASRDELAHNLQKDGPVVLRSLTVNDILQLVDLLIADKKWLEESPSQVYPFRVTEPVKKSSLAGVSHGANGLRSIFLRTSESRSQKSSEHDVEKHDQNVHRTRVSTPATETKDAERSRNDILVDSQKLVNEIVREYPGGYNIGSFRKLFLERYGYQIDVQKLGYKKLASLFQTMPGARVESGHIFPSVPVCDFDQETSILKTQVTDATHAVYNSDSELSDPVSNDDNNDSPWEELGPVSVNNSDQSDLESLSSPEGKENTTNYHDYEPIGSYYDSSESEGDSSCLTQPEEQGKSNFNEQDSSFWEVLDLWGSSKEGENSIKKSDNGDILGNSMADILNSSLEQTRVSLSKAPSGNYREKQRSQKKYSFVADSGLPEKDKLIDCIFDGFKKSNESKMQN